MCVQKAYLELLCHISKWGLLISLTEIQVINIWSDSVNIKLNEGMEKRL